MESYNYIILAIALFLAVVQINSCTNLISTYLILYVISFEYYRKVHKAIFYAFFLLGFFVVLKILLSYNEKYLGEHFEEQKKDKKEDLERLDEMFTKKELKEINNLSKEEISNLENEKLDSDEKPLKKSEEFVSLDNMSPMMAQKELFRLVNTSKLLKETMDQLTPALKEGNKIMKSFEQLNMIKK